MPYSNRVCILTLFEIMHSKIIWFTAFTFQGHATSSLTTSLDLRRQFPISG